MPSEVPPDYVVRAFLDGITDHTRRVELYEPNGTTLWRPDIPIGVVDGTISVQSGSSERRTLDLKIDNSDQLFAAVPGGLWYDKIVKVFRGVNLKRKRELPIIGLNLFPVYEGTFGPKIQSALSAIGYGNTRLIPFEETDAERYARAIECDILISMEVSEDDFPGTGEKLAKLTRDAAAYGIPTFSMGEHGHDEFSSVFPSGTTFDMRTWNPSTQFGPLPIDHPVAQGWNSFLATWTRNPAGTNLQFLYGVTLPSDPSPWTRIGRANGTYDALVALEGVDIKWVAFLYPVHPALMESAFDSPGFRMMMLSALNWLNPIENVTSWETQIGEFMIDRISMDHYPRVISITGRDYVKKCSSSKYLFATQFSTGQSLEGIIGAIAGAAGVTKRLLPITGITVNKTFYFDRGVTRWDAMDEIAKSYDYQVYFDSKGFLVLEPQSDPATQQPNFWLRTGGDDGSLVKFSKSTTDTRIYNVVVVTGESSDSSALPVYAIARNENPSSPTSIQRIGERVYQYTSSWITTEEQAQNVADSFLAVHALEEFEVNFESLLLPWMDAGDIIGFEDTDPNDDAPERLLLSSLSIPLKLGSMSGTGKRVVAF